MIHSAEAAFQPSRSFPLRERDGSNPIERMALYRAQLEMKSMPSSLVVQIALWPDKLADWSREMGVSPAVVYNMLAGVKPYHRVRTLLARRLDVPKVALDHLIEAPRPEPLAKLPPEPPQASVPLTRRAALLPRSAAHGQPHSAAGDESAQRVREVAVSPSVQGSGRRRTKVVRSGTQISLNI